MTRWMTLLPASTVGAVLLLHSPVQAQTVPMPLPVSLERIRAALREPPPIFQVPAPPFEVATFRVEVEQFYNAQPIPEEVFDPTYGLPSVGQLMMGGIGQIGSAAAGYKQRRAKKKARKEVEDALAEFCAVNACPATPTGK